MDTQILSIFQNLDFDHIKDHPNILIAAAFWEEERYQAARVCYKYMRALDDLIDCHKSIHKFVDKEERENFTKRVNAWLSMTRGNDQDPEAEARDLLETIQRFHIPLWPLEEFARSMLYDIDHEGFATLDDFIKYSQGASVSPASIFVHLNGLRKAGNHYLPPVFNVRQAATPCALFSYVVHIIRDFQIDQHNNLNYFADDILTRNHLTPRALHDMAHGSPITLEFRNMIREYMLIAGKYRDDTHQVIREIWPLIGPRYRLSLQIIFNLYLMVFERIDPENGKFTTEELNPTPDEIRNRVLEIIQSFPRS